MDIDLLLKCLTAMFVAIAAYYKFQQTKVEKSHNTFTILPITKKKNVPKKPTKH